MKNVKTLQSAIEREQRHADGFRKQSEKIRVELNTLGLNADPQIVAAKQREAQQNEEKAVAREQSIRDMTQQIADLQTQAMEIERKKQDAQATAQSQLDRLDREKNVLLGE